MNHKQILVLATLIPEYAHAYIGPGAGLGAVATLVAIILGTLMLIVGFLWFPLKRVLTKRKERSAEEHRPSSTDEEQ